MDITADKAQRHSEEEFSTRLSTFIDAGAGVVHVRTTEPLRAAVAVRRRALIDRGTVHEWDAVNGFREFSEQSVGEHLVGGDNNIDPMMAFMAPLNELRRSDRVQKESVDYYCFIGIQPYMENNPAMTHLLTMYSHLLPSSNVAVILITPDIPLPVDNMSILTVPFDTPGLGELHESLSRILEGVEEDFPEGQSLTDEEKNKLCFIGAGLTRNGFEMYTALATVQAARDGKDSIGFDDLANGISLGKTDVVNASDILELYRPTDMSRVGGLENLKHWVGKRRECYSDAAREFGIEPPKGIVLVGPPGCAYGGTEITYRRGTRNSGRTLTLEGLYCKFNGLPYETAGTGNATPWHDRTLPTYIQSLDPEGKIFYNRVISVVQSGKKPVIRITVDTGESIQLTASHPVAIPGGSFIPTGGLRVGSVVLMKGSMLPVNTGGRKVDARPPRKAVAVNYHPYTAKQARYARLVVEAHMNGMPVDEFIHILKHNEPLSLTLRYLTPEYDVHHMDEDTLNDDLSNLMVIEAVEHSRLHGKNENFNVEYVREATVVSVEELPARMTYDVQMDMPANNFVAEGFIVHNTGKSLIAKAISSELGVPLVRLDFGRVFQSLVGASEQRMRQALRMVEGMSPCVLFCDEIDKGLGGIGGSGDSGTSNRVLGSFLTWLQDCTHPVFVMVTANNVTGLPPEMMRRGRFDAIFATAMPTARERREVLRIHLQLRGRDIEDFPPTEVDDVVLVSEGYVPAEIESAVKDALVDAFDKGEELSMKHVMDALTSMVPLSKAFAEKITEMNEWAKANATPAGLISGPASAVGNARRVSVRKRSGVRNLADKN